MDSTESYNAMTNPARTAAENAAKYVEFVQRTVEANLQFAAKWTQIMGSLTGVVGEQAAAAGHDVFDHPKQAAEVVTAAAEEASERLSAKTDKNADAVSEQVAKAAKAARQQAEKIKQAAAEQAEEASQVAATEAGKAAQDAARQAKADQRRLAKIAHDKAREPYQGLKKAQLSELLAQRHLPKTGNLEELVGRLVKADAK